jgi:hypothetical protein
MLHKMTRFSRFTRFEIFSILKILVNPVSNLDPVHGVKEILTLRIDIHSKLLARKSQPLF